MAATIERAKQEDPRELRRRIASLEQQLAQANKVATAPVKVRTEVREVPVLGKRDQKRLKHLVESGKAVGSYLDWLRDEMKALDRELEEFRSGITTLVGAVTDRRERVPPPTAAPAVRVQQEARPAPTKPERSGTGAEEISEYARGLLETVAQRWPMRLTPSQVAILSGRSPRSSSFVVSLSELLKAGLLSRDRDHVVLTRAGEQAVGHVPLAPTSPEEVRETWRRALPDYERSLYDVLGRVYPQWLTLEDLAPQAGRSVTSSSFNVALSTLVKNKLADRESGKVRASAILFPEGVMS